MQDRRINDLARRLERFMAGYGYERIETPIIQPAALFLTKAGDQIINRLFTFERLGKQLALRPEFTALAAHTYVVRYPEHQPVVRWQFGGAVFEDGARDAQQFSIGAELIGKVSDTGSPAADAEIIALATNGATAQGLASFKLIIGHAHLMRVLLERFKLDSRTQRFLLNHLHLLPTSGKAHILEQLDKLLLGKGVVVNEDSDDAGSEIGTQQMLDVLLDATQRGATMGGRTRHDIVRRLLEKRQRAAERTQVAAALDFLEAWSAIRDAPEAAFSIIEAMIPAGDTEARGILDEWRRVIVLLDAYGIPESRIEIQPALARSWDYYTGMIFELWSDDHHIGGGGRYDELTRLVGGEYIVPAVGFAYYVEPLLEALPATDEPPLRSVIINAEADALVSAVGWAQALRERGQAVVLANGNEHSDDSFIAHANGSLRRGGETFAFTDIETLINDLERHV